jgi:heme exporter protein D
VTPDLGPYAAEVLAAYGVTATLLAGIVGLSLWQARRARARLDEAEGRRERKSKV